MGSCLKSNPQPIPAPQPDQTAVSFESFRVRLYQQLQSVRVQQVTSSIGGFFQRYTQIDQYQVQQFIEVVQEKITYLQNVCVNGQVTQVQVQKIVTYYARILLVMHWCTTYVEQGSVYDLSDWIYALQGCQEDQWGLPSIGGPIYY